ncbi:hypothetical protein [Kordiimonas sp.]|uniref:hypothetical protein n=1 Tax=Kordiimonas sp. TaxID=1970157 RepID=UPI003A951212
MKALSAHFLRAAVIYAILGMALGIHMASSEDHSQMPTHAHLMLLGWVSMALYGVIYRGFDDIAAGKLMMAHKWLAHLGLIGLVVALYSMFSGVAGIEPLAGISSIIVLVSMILFAVIVFKNTEA